MYFSKFIVTILKNKNMLRAGTFKSAAKGFNFSFLSRSLLKKAVFGENLARLLKIRMFAWPDCVFLFVGRNEKGQGVSFEQPLLKCQHRVISRAPTEPRKTILQKGRIYRMVLCLHTAT